MSYNYVIGLVYELGILIRAHYYPHIAILCGGPHTELIMKLLQHLSLVSSHLFPLSTHASKQPFKLKRLFFSNVKPQLNYPYQKASEVLKDFPFNP